MSRLTGPLTDALIVALLLVVTMGLGWIGHLASGDGSYITAAEAWLHGFPVISDNHWAVRHPLNVAIANSVTIFGAGDTAWILPWILYGLALLIMLFVVFRTAYGDSCAAVDCGFLVVTLLFAEQIATAGVDMAEAFYVIASLVAFLAGAARNGAPGLSVFSGTLAGLAALSHEKAAPAIERWRYVLSRCFLVYAIAAALVCATAVWQLYAAQARPIAAAIVLLFASTSMLLIDPPIRNFYWLNALRFRWRGTRLQFILIREPRGDPAIRRRHGGASLRTESSERRLPRAAFTSIAAAASHNGPAIR